MFTTLWSNAIGCTVNRLFNCSMLQKQPLKNLTNFLSEIGSSGVVSSLQNCFNVPKHFTDFWMVTWKHSFSVHQTHQEDRPDKNTTDSFCFNEFLFNDKKPWMDVGDIHQTMPLLFRLRDKNASLTQLCRLEEIKGFEQQKNARKKGF